MKTSAAPCAVSSGDKVLLLVRAEDSTVQQCVFDGERWGEWVNVGGTGRTVDTPCFAFMPVHE